MARWAGAGAGIVLETLDRAWRVAATGLGFALFGLGGLIFRFVVFPVVALTVRDRRRQQTVARTLIRYAFVALVRLLRLLGVMTLEVRGAERLQRRGALVLANHPTLLDVVLLMALVRDADCIVKSTLSGNPFTSGPVGMAGFIRNRSGPGLIDEAVASVNSGSNLVVFPEGTRTPASGELLLQRGAANIALRGGLDITPVLIHSRPPVLTKGMRWWQVPRRRVHFCVEVQEDIPIAGFIDADVPQVLAARKLTRFLSDHFAKELPRASA